MDRSEMDTLLQAIKRVERKLDTVIRAIYEHDEDIQDEYGRSQRTIDAGLAREAEREAGDVLGSINESSLPECDVPGVPIGKRSPIGEANPATNNGKVPREESIPRGNRENKDVSRKDGVQQHATSKPYIPYRGNRGGKGKRSFNDAT